MNMPVIARLKSNMTLNWAIFNAKISIFMLVLVYYYTLYKKSLVYT